MAIRVQDIQATDWSITVGNPGQVVKDADDINQCIGIILTTRPGSDPHRPLFGCNAWLHLDKPIPVARPLVVADVVEALELWEPRIKVVRVTTTFSGNTVTVLVEWTYNDDDTIHKTEVRINGTA
jgi:hypothetical protein